MINKKVKYLTLNINKYIKKHEVKFCRRVVKEGITETVACNVRGMIQLAVILD